MKLGPELGRLKVLDSPCYTLVLDVKEANWMKRMKKEF